MFPIKIQLNLFFGTLLAPSFDEKDRLQILGTRLAIMTRIEELEGITPEDRSRNELFLRIESDLHRLALSLEALVQIKSAELALERAEHEIEYHDTSKCSADRKNAVDVLIADEAHRIRKTSQSRFTPRHKRLEIPQIEELIKAKVTVFFIDDDQVVRPGEIGSVNYIKEFAQKSSCKLPRVRALCRGSSYFTF